MKLLKGKEIKQKEKWVITYRGTSTWLAVDFPCEYWRWEDKNWDYILKVLGGGAIEKYYIQQNLPSQIRQNRDALDK